MGVSNPSYVVYTIYGIVTMAIIDVAKSCSDCVLHKPPITDDQTKMGLQKLCKSAIMSALLERRALDREMLDRALPLPPALKDSIIDEYMTVTEEYRQTQ